ncbi:hypothetical protein J6590_043422 [Homalodisca vitripennis]|nr:hypothetical protein J6590_043422 [Homalodisca vitripennis]
MPFALQCFNFNSCNKCGNSKSIDDNGFEPVRGLLEFLWMTDLVDSNVRFEHQRLSEGILSPELRIVARYCCNQHWGLSGNVKRQIFFHRTATSSSISQRHRPRSSKPLTPNQNRARCNTSGIFGERSKGNQPKQ